MYIDSDSFGSASVNISFNDSTLKNIIVTSRMNTSELGDDLLRWLRSLKLSKEISTVEDFQNGFYFGEVFNRLGLRRNKPFHNKADLSCVFQNFKNARELLYENFKVDIPIDNLIYRAKDILATIKENAQKMQENRSREAEYTMMEKQKETTRQQEMLGTMKRDSRSQFSSTMNMPKKIVDIETKLQKYRDEKVKHELMALEERKKEVLQNQRAIQTLRNHQRNQLRSNHEFVKTLQAKIDDGVKATQQIKLARLEKQRNFEEFMKSKKVAYVKSLRDQDQTDFKEGLQTFQMNCLKLGIDLVKDIDKVMKEKDKPDKTFNSVAYMERIKAASQKQELARKQKVKRINNMNIEQQLAQKKAEEVFGEQALVERYAQASINESKQMAQARYAKLRKDFEHDQRVQKAYQNAHVQYDIVFDQAKQLQRQQQMRQKRLQYMQINYERKLKKREKHNAYAADIIDSILDLTEICYAEQRKNNTIEIPYKYWLTMVDKFIENRPFNNRGPNSAIPKIKKKISGLTKQQQEQFNSEFQMYLKQKGDWTPLRDPPHELRNQYLAKPLQIIINIAYPQGKMPEKPKLPLYMPLKVIVVGSTMSGRKTQAQKMSAKYGLIYIDPWEATKQALNLANPPVVEEKKGAKKEAKKVDQDKPEKLPLKEFGLKIKDSLKSIDEATPQILLEAFTLKLKENFVYKTPAEQIIEFQEAEKKENDRYAQQLKQFQDGNAKKKKDPKKPVEPEQPPKPNKYPYTKGFVMVGFPNKFPQVTKFEEVIGGYVSEDVLKNPQAEKFMEKCSEFVKFPEKTIDTRLKSPTVDYIFSLDAPKQLLDTRNQGRKMDPTTNQVYHMTLNPPPTDVKGLVQRLVEIPPANIQQIQTDQIENFYKYRGIQEAKIGCFQQIDSSDAIPNVFKKIQAHIDTILNFKTDRYRQQVANLNKQPDPSPAQENSAQKQNSLQLKPQTEKLQVQQTLSPSTANKLLQMLNFLLQNYSEDQKQSLIKLRQCRQAFLSRYDEIQRSFLDIILRPDDKTLRIKTFQDTYNKLLQDKQGLLQIQQAKNHLLDKLDKLYDGLWESICAKKDQGVGHRANLINSNWIQNQASGVIDIAERIIQIQLNKTTELLEFTIAYLLTQNQQAIDDSNEHLLVESSLPDGRILISIDIESGQFPRLQQLYENISKAIDSLPEWAKYRRTKQGLPNSFIGQDIFDNVLQQLALKLRIKVDQILEQITSRLMEYRVFYNLLINRMDDWIIYGIKRENDLAYSYIKEIKKFISEAKKSNFKEGTNFKEISDIYKPYTRISKVHLPICESTGEPISIEQARVLVQDIKTLANDHLIQYELLKQYLSRRLSSNLLKIKPINFDYLQQYFVQEGKVNKFEVSVTFILFNSDMPIEQDIQSYRQKLNSISTEGRLTLSKFLSVPAFFENEQPRCMAICMKYLLFEVFRSGPVDEVDVDIICETFNQLSRMEVDTFSHLMHGSR